MTNPQTHWYQEPVPVEQAAADLGYISSNNVRLQQYPHKHNFAQAGSYFAQPYYVDHTNSQQLLMPTGFLGQQQQFDSNQAIRKREETTGPQTNGKIMQQTNTQHQMGLNSGGVGGRNPLKLSVVMDYPVQMTGADGPPSAGQASGYRTPPAKEVKSRNARISLLERSPVIGENQIFLSSEEENNKGIIAGGENSQLIYNNDANKVMGSAVKLGIERVAAHSSMNSYRQASHLLESMKVLAPRDSGLGESPQTQPSTFVMNATPPKQHKKGSLGEEQQQYCPIHSQGLIMNVGQNQNKVDSSRYGQVLLQYPSSSIRQLGGGQRVRCNSNNLQCTCQSPGGYVQAIHTVQQPLKKQRALAKQRTKRKGSLVSGEYTPEEEAEIKEIFNSDESCRQLFSDKKSPNNQNKHSRLASTTTNMQLMQPNQQMTTGQQDQGNNQNLRPLTQFRHATELSQADNDDSIDAKNNNDVSCFLDILNDAEHNSNDGDLVLLNNGKQDKQFESQAANPQQHQKQIEQHQQQQYLSNVAQSTSICNDVANELRTGGVANSSQDETLSLVQAVSMELAQVFEKQYNAKDQQVLELFQSDAQFSILVQQTPESGGQCDERNMTTFEAIGMMDSEGISQLSIARDTMDINYDPQQGKKLFYATFDGVCQLNFGQKNFRISFMICSGQEPDTTNNFRVNATKMQFM